MKYAEYLALKEGPKISLKLARDLGETRYRTGAACLERGHLGWRRVRDGKCLECLAGSPPLPRSEHEFQLMQDRTEKPTTAMMEKYPDMVISRDDATVVGFIVYRTGEPCGQNHRAWRNVHNNECVSCLRLDPPGPDERVISKSVALDRQFPMYRTGEPCEKGHTGWRYVENDQCEECSRA